MNAANFTVACKQAGSAGRVARRRTGLSISVAARNLFAYKKTALSRSDAGRLCCTPRATLPALPCNRRPPKVSKGRAESPLVRPEAQPPHNATLQKGLLCNRRLRRFPKGERKAPATPAGACLKTMQEYPVKKGSLPTGSEPFYRAAALVGVHGATSCPMTKQCCS